MEDLRVPYAAQALRVPKFEKPRNDGTLPVGTALLTLEGAICHGAARARTSQCQG